MAKVIHNKDLNEYFFMRLQYSIFLITKRSERKKETIPKKTRN